MWEFGPAPPWVAVLAQLAWWEQNFFHVLVLHFRAQKGNESVAMDPDTCRSLAAIVKAPMDPVCILVLGFV